MVSQQIIQENREDSGGEEAETSKEEKKEDGPKNKINNFDPDEDGFIFGYDKAYTLHKNMNILQFIRKSILPNNCKAFELGIPTLQEQFG